MRTYTHLLGITLEAFLIRFPIYSYIVCKKTRVSRLIKRFDSWQSMDGIQSLNEPLRVAGGGSGLPKVLGIPKPTAVVKGYPKPTHPVAPMPPATNPPTPLYATFDKEKSVHKTAETNGDCRKPGQPPLKSEKVNFALIFGYGSSRC